MGSPRVLWAKAHTWAPGSLGENLTSPRPCQAEGTPRLSAKVRGLQSATWFPVGPACPLPQDPLTSTCILHIFHEPPWAGVVPKPGHVEEGHGPPCCHRKQPRALGGKCWGRGRGTEHRAEKPVPERGGGDLSTGEGGEGHTRQRDSMGKCPVWWVGARAKGRVDAGFLREAFGDRRAILGETYCVPAVLMVPSTHHLS